MIAFCGIFHHLEDFPFLSRTPLQNFLQASMITAACLIVRGQRPGDTPPEKNYKKMMQFDVFWCIV